MRLNCIGMIFRIALVKLHSMVYVFPIPDRCCTCEGQITDDRTGHCKFRLDCRTKKKAKDGPLALLVHITLGKVRVFSVSIPPQDLPSKNILP